MSRSVGKGKTRQKRNEPSHTGCRTCSAGPSSRGGAAGFSDLSEVDVVRHYTRLSQWNFGVDSGMYPLGSCTMKYNPKINEKQASRPGFAAAHPLLPPELSQGALRLMYELEGFLAEITGMDAVSVQPAAGAQGELAGMLIIHAYHKSEAPNAPKSSFLTRPTGRIPRARPYAGFIP